MVTTIVQIFNCSLSINFNGGIYIVILELEVYMQVWQIVVSNVLEDKVFQSHHIIVVVVYFFFLFSLRKKTNSCDSTVHA